MVPFYCAGGATSSDICRKSGAYVQFDGRSSSDAAEKTCLIRGTPDEAKKAAVIIAEKADRVSIHDAISISKHLYIG